MFNKKKRELVLSSLKTLRHLKASTVFHLTSSTELGEKRHCEQCKCIRYPQGGSVVVSRTPSPLCCRGHMRTVGLVSRDHVAGRTTQSQHLCTVGGVRCGLL